MGRTFRLSKLDQKPCFQPCLNEFPDFSVTIAGSGLNKNKTGCMGFGMKSLAPRTAAGMRWFAADVDGKLCSSVPHQATERGAVRSGARIPSAALAPALQTDAQFSIGKRNKVKLIASLANQASVQARTSPTMPEIAVIGRTNSGKSSLINHLLGKKLAKTSSRAGKTTAIDLYRVNDALVLADVPGYGFEHVGSELDKKWSRVWGPLW